MREFEEVSLDEVILGPGAKAKKLLGGPWVVICVVISRVTITITHIRGLITLLITNHETPSTVNYYDIWEFPKIGDPSIVP